MIWTYIESIICQGLQEVRYIQLIVKPWLQTYVFLKYFFEKNKSTIQEI